MMTKPAGLDTGDPQINSCRALDVGKIHRTAMCALRGPGFASCIHEGYGQGQQSVVCNLGAEAVALPVNKGRHGG